MNKIFFLRPHHSLCIQFFVGKGYSEDFVKNMTNIIKLLQESDPEVTLQCSCDILCEKCPENISGICKNDCKVRDIDNRCLTEIGLSCGSKIRWSELKQLAYDKIIKCGKIEAVCYDCQWKEICINLAYDKK